MATAEETELSEAVAQALSTSVRLEQYPKSLIDLYVTVLEDDGCALAAAITCASLALANAGIELNDMVAGCT
jgi:exosome complex component MTR3